MSVKRSHPSQLSFGSRSAKGKAVFASAWIDFTEDRLNLCVQGQAASSKEGLLTEAELATLQDSLDEIAIRWPDDGDAKSAEIAHLLDRHKDLYPSLVVCNLWNCPTDQAASAEGYSGSDLWWQVAGDDPSLVFGAFYWEEHSGLDQVHLHISKSDHHERWRVRLEAIADDYYRIEVDAEANEVRRDPSC